MKYKAGDIILYTNNDGSAVELEAVANATARPCAGCVGEAQHKKDISKVCARLPQCSGGEPGDCWVWREVT